MGRGLPTAVHAPGKTGTQPQASIIDIEQVGEEGIADID